MMGGAQYVQFNYEVIEQSRDLGAARASHASPHLTTSARSGGTDGRGGHTEQDALAEEEAERKNRELWNKRFKEFAKGIEAQAQCVPVALPLNITWT
jgi:hypothetical protein